MYGSPMISFPAQIISWIAAGAPSGAAARPSTKRAVVPGTKSSGRAVGPVEVVMPLPIVSSVGMVLGSAAASGAVATLPPVLGMLGVLLAAVPTVEPAGVGATNGTTSPVPPFS